MQFITIYQKIFHYCILLLLFFCTNLSAKESKSFDKLPQELILLMLATIFDDFCAQNNSNSDYENVFKETSCNKFVTNAYLKASLERSYLSKKMRLCTLTHVKILSNKYPFQLLTSPFFIRSNRQFNCGLTDEPITNLLFFLNKSFNVSNNCNYHFIIPIFVKENLYFKSKSNQHFETLESRQPHLNHFTIIVQKDFKDIESMSLPFVFDAVNLPPQVKYAKKLKIVFISKIQKDNTSDPFIIANLNTFDQVEELTLDGLSVANLGHLIFLNTSMILNFKAKMIVRINHWSNLDKTLKLLKFKQYSLKLLQAALEKTIQNINSHLQQAQASIQEVSIKEEIESVLKIENIDDFYRGLSRLQPETLIEFLPNLCFMEITQETRQGFIYLPKNLKKLNLLNVKSSKSDEVSKLMQAVQLFFPNLIIEF